MEKCLDKEMALPADWSETLAGIIRQLCLSPDPYLDRGTDVFVAGTDVLNAAIATTRGRGLRVLLRYNLWAQLFGATSPAAIEARNLLRSILGERFAGRPIVTSGELALLAYQFSVLAAVDPEWTRENLPNLYPRQADPQLWAVAFGQLVLLQNPYPLLFELLADEFRYAVENLPLLREPVEGNYQKGSKVEALGFHLFFYFVWSRVTLSGSDSLLEKFYESTTIKERAAVMRRTGRAIHQSTGIDADLKRRACEFVDYRLTLAEQSSAEDRAIEMGGLTNWITSRALDPVWRLRTLNRALSIGKYVATAMPLVEALNELVPADPATALRCFAQITEWATDPSFYIDPDEGKAILAAGFAHANPTIRETANAAKEQLLGAGRYEYL